MGREELDRALGRVIGASAEKVAALGFRCRRSTLRAMRPGYAGLIEFQKGSGSSGDRILFTVNLAVVCEALLEPHDPPLQKAGSIDGHLRERLGMLMTERGDKWWEIREGVDAEALADEVSALVATVGAPYVARHLDREELIALWAAGRSPGLTEAQRARYLAALRAH